MNMENLIEIRDLSIDFSLNNGVIHAVDHLNMNIPKGVVTAVIGESGSGKSTLATGIMNLVAEPGRITGGQVLYQGKDVLKLTKDELRKYRWEQVSMVFQAAQNALNPVMTVGEQFLETMQLHIDNYDEAAAIKKMTQLLGHVRLEADRVLKAYPHELSGGMKQRVMIALSMLLDPRMIILDEPTTALDVITQSYIFDILKHIHEETGITMLLLTHDIAIVAKVAERLGVMYAGHLVEIGEIRTIFRNPRHPYTRGLLKAAPSLLDDPEKHVAIPGGPPDLFNMPKGCSFYPRCVAKKSICEQQRPDMVAVGSDHMVACYVDND